MNQKASLYSLVKEKLPPKVTAISDSEILILNRRDFHITQISGVNATLTAFGVGLGYPYRVLLALIDQLAAAIPKTEDFNIVLADPSLTIAAFQAWMKAGGTLERGRIYAPRGIAKLPTKDSLLGALVSAFEAQTNSAPIAALPQDRKSAFTMVLGNTKAKEQTIFAAERYADAEKGVLILKDYARTDAHDERDLLEANFIFPCITFEGHAFALKL